jgi:hypothetical protein
MGSSRGDVVLSAVMQTSKQDRQIPANASAGEPLLHAETGDPMLLQHSLILPDGLGYLCLDLPSRQTDIVDQMGIGLRHLLKFPAKAFPLVPGRYNASQGRQAVVST